MLFNCIQEPDLGFLNVTVHVLEMSLPASLSARGVDAVCLVNCAFS
jgi:hypothetical protein